MQIAWGMEDNDYRDLELIHDGRHYLVYRGRSAGDRPVVIKTPRPGPGTDDRGAALRDEHAVLQSLNEVAPRAAVAKALALEQTRDGPPALVLEDAGSKNARDWLKHRPLDLGRFLPLALDVARSVALLHAHQILHRDINPYNLVIGDDGRPTLVDFDASTRIIGLFPGEPPDELAGTLLYIAPEQTGRMSRGVDHRADLYSLGATFYELLSGSPPFVLSDPIELVHAHMARSPVPPTAANPKVPSPLSDIVLKLLAKSPEQRYQSADALRADLEEARDQWRRSETIVPFELGRADLARALAFPDKLYGRQRELEVLTAALSRANAGAHEVAWVRGPTGVGKSALLAALATESGISLSLAVGKATPVPGQVPYAPWIEALRPLLREIVEQPHEVRARWRQSALEAVGRNASILADLLPEIEELCGRQPPVAPLGAVESERRVHFTIAALIRVLGTADRPLLLVVDDLQWADAAALKLLEVVATDPRAHHLLVTVAYRDDFIDGEHPVTRTIEAIRAARAGVVDVELPCLDEEALTELLADTLRTSSDSVRGLARVLLQKTAGNALFVKRFLQALQRRRLLLFDLETGAWRWDADEIERTEVTENVADLMSESIRHLPPESQHLLRIAACFQSRINLELLAAVAGDRVESVAALLWSALREGLLIAAESTDGTATYRFAHDRVQEAAEALSSAAERRRMHLRIGRALREWPGARLDKNLFEMVDQLNLGAELIDDPQERLDLVHYNAVAASTARRSSAYGRALNYLRRGIELLGGDEAWLTHRELMARLHRDAAECAYLDGDHARSSELITSALERARSATETADLVNVQVIACSTRGELDEAIRWGEVGLSALGLELPPDAESAWATERTAVRGRLGDADRQTLLRRPHMTALEQRSRMELLSNLLSPAYVRDPYLFAFIAGRMVNVSLAHGNSVYSAFAYTALGMVLGFLDGDYATAHRLGHVGVELSAQFDDPVQECRANHVFGCFVNHWRAPLASSLPVLRRAVARGVEGGELQFAVYAAGTAILTRFHMGHPLAEVAAEIEEALLLAASARVKAGVEYELAYRQAVRCLQGRTYGPGRFDDDDFDEATHIEACDGNPLSLALYYVARLETAFFARQFDEADRMSKAAQPHLAAVWGIVPLPEHNFFSSLALAAGVRGPDTLFRIRENQRQMALWAENAPDNYRHKYLLVQAELARLEERPLDAAGAYDDAAEAAARAGSTSDQAIANELCGRLWAHLGRRRVAHVYLSAALDLYARWGATSKVSSLEEEFHDVVPQATSGGPEPDSGAGFLDNALDAKALLKAAETLSSEVVLERLLDKLMAVSMEVAGATGAALILKHEGDLVTRATAPSDAAPDIPRTLIDHAYRENEPIVLGDAAREGRFVSDPVIRANRSKSALAVPICRQEHSVGVLYLENNLATRAFSPQRVRVLALLSSQIAISLENSLLFEGMQVEMTERQRAEQSVRFLADAGISLAQSLEQEATLARITRLAVPSLATWCVVDAIRFDGPGDAAAAHADPEAETALRDRVADAAASEVTAEVRATERPQLLTLDDGARSAWVPSDTRSIMAVPLVAPSGNLGTIVFGSSRTYTDSDLLLANEFGRRAALALDHARLYRRAQEAVHVRDEFLSIASHELKTPLTSLQLAAQALSDGELEGSPQILGRVSAVVERQTKRLSSLVEDLLNVSRIHSGRLHFQLDDVDLADVVREVVEQFESQASRAGTPLVVRSAGPVTGHWDRDRLDQVVTNLISNAIKFGAGKPVEITVESTDDTGKLTVTDHGIGISADRLPYVFERFQRAVSASQYGGLGLGLYISRQIVTALGGTVTARSTPGTGATFTVEVPRGGPDTSTTVGREARA